MCAEQYIRIFHDCPADCRPLLLTGQIGCTCTLLAIGLITWLMPETVNGHPDTLRSYLVLGGMLGVFGALGFLLAITLMAGVRERLETSHIPDQFKGFPIGLFMAGLMSVAFMGFNGLV